MFLNLPGTKYVRIIILSDFSLQLLDNKTIARSQGLTLLVEFLPSITMTGLNVLIPPFFTKVVPIEDYTPENEDKITIARYA